MCERNRSLPATLMLVNSLWLCGHSEIYKKLVGRWLHSVFKSKPKQTQLVVVKLGKLTRRLPQNCYVVAEILSLAVKMGKYLFSSA